jgi:hypothetical protein
MQILGIPFQPFRGREHNYEFLSVQQKIETYSRKAVPNHSVEEKTNSEPVFLNF